ncbi:unnamed protein product [Victoria cruziana]
MDPVPFLSPSHSQVSLYNFVVSSLPTLSYFGWLLPWPQSRDRNHSSTPSVLLPRKRRASTEEERQPAD